MRSTRVRVVFGVALLIAAAVVKFVGVPYACRLPEGFAASQRLTGDYQELDPHTFDLGAPIAVDARRDTAVEKTDGSTALIRSTTVLDLPSGPVTSEDRYAVDRSDFGQVPPPAGTKVQDQLGGMVISRPIGAGTDSFKVYNPVLAKTQRMAFTGEGEVHGRRTYGFTGTASGVIADDQISAPYRSAIAEMAKTGDGTTIPKLLLEMIAADVPARYAAGLKAVLPQLPDEVPIRLSLDDTTSMALDQQLGAPITLAAEQTTVLNVLVDFGLIPVLPLSRVTVHSTDESAAEAARFMTENGRKLMVAGRYLPLALTSAAIGILAAAAIGGVAARRRAGESEGTTANPVTEGTWDEPILLESEQRELLRR